MESTQMNNTENKQMIDDELQDMEKYYGLLDDEYDEMRENGVSWSDFIWRNAPFVEQMQKYGELIIKYI